MPTRMDAEIAPHLGKIERQRVAVLRRRIKHLRGLKRDANSYDRAELAALRWAVWKLLSPLEADSDASG